MIHLPRVFPDMAWLTVPLALPRANAGAWCVVALMAVTLLAGAGGPEIIRARAPANDVSKWFPAGTELRVMAANEFESLVARANAGIGPPTRRRHGRG